MQSDDVIWSVINGFCSYKIKAPTHRTFCRNEYNLTGLCTRSSCPLQSRYATVREVDGKVYLFVKTPERAHSPARMWEKIRLSSNYSKALEQIDQELPYWSNFIVHKAKQRLTKITQYLIKLRKIRLREEQGDAAKLVGINKKTERREATREEKALRAAKLEKSIEAELLNRLKSGAYGDAPLNVNEEVWQNVLEGRKRKEADAADALELEDEESDEEDEELLSEMEREWEEEEEGVGEREFVSDQEESDDEDADDIEDDVYGSSDEEGSEEGADDDDEEDDGDDDEPDPSSRKRKSAPGGAGTAAGAAPNGKAAQRPAKKGKKSGGDKRRLEVEYEDERETQPLSRSEIADW